MMECASSFHADLELQLRADLAQTFGLSAAAIFLSYLPPRAQPPGLLVWVEPRADEEVERRSTGELLPHPYDLHLRLRTQPGSALEGSLLRPALFELADSLRRRYADARPFVRAIPALYRSECELPREPVWVGGRTLEVVVRVRFLELLPDPPGGPSETLP